MNGSGGSSGTRAAESICAIDFSSTAAESGARDGTTTGTPVGWHGEGTRVPAPWGRVSHAAPDPNAQPDHPGDSARTRDPPTVPWHAQHGQSGPGVGSAPPVPCSQSARAATTLPSMTAGAERGPGMEQPGPGGGDVGSRGTAMPTHVTTASLRSHTLPAASFQPPSPCAAVPRRGAASRLRGWRKAGCGRRGPWGAGGGQPMPGSILPTGVGMPVPAEPGGLVTRGWATVPAQPRGVARGQGQGPPQPPGTAKGRGHGAERAQPGLNPPPPPCCRTRPTHGSSGYK